MLRQLARSPPSKDARSISLLTEAVSFLVGERAFWRSIPNGKRRTKFMRQWQTLILSLVLSLLLPLLLSLLSLLSDEESAASAIAAVSGTFVAMSVFNSVMSSSL